jgi:CrcB protein
MWFSLVFNYICSFIYTQKTMLKHILFIGFGGFIGSVLRYFVSKLNNYWAVLSIPVGTLLVNIVGSFLIGLISAYALKTGNVSQEIKLFLITGLMGGFTTFSAFSNENVIMMQNGQFVAVALYTGLSVFLAFLAALLGYILIK